MTVIIFASVVGIIAGLLVFSKIFQEIALYSFLNVAFTGLRMKIYNPHNSYLRYESVF